MALRPARCIRDTDKVAWTRFSRRVQRKSYIKAMPHADLHQFRMGTNKEDYDLIVHLVNEEPIVLRDNALEACRRTLNKYLEKHLAGNYYLMVRVYPHHIIRENKMISGAGADRLQKGMRRAFGRPTDRAARIKRPGTAVFTIYTYAQNMHHVKKAFERGKRKLSGHYKLVSESAA